VSSYADGAGGPGGRATGATCDIGGQGQEGAVDGEHLADRVGQVGRGRQAAAVRLSEQVIDDGFQDGRVDQAAKVGQGALGETVDGEVSLRLAGAAEVLQGPEGAQGGVEEGQEMGDEDSELNKLHDGRRGVDAPSDN
jgi:hypothetical protein